MSAKNGPGFDVIGFSEAAPGTGTVNIAGGLSDTLYRVNGDNIKSKERAKNLLGLFYGIETAGARALIRQSSLLKDHIFTAGIDLNSLDQRGGLSWRGSRPLPIIGAEDIQALSQNATDEDTIIAAFLGSERWSQQRIDSAPLPDHLLRGIIDQTIVANTWTAGSATFDFDLPKGDYVLLGLKAWHFLATAGSCIIRVIFDNTTWRPGVMTHGMTADKTSLIAAITEMPNQMWPHFPAFSFSNERMPTFEMLSPIANTDFVVELEVRKVGPGGK